MPAVVVSTLPTVAVPLIAGTTELTGAVLAIDVRMDSAVWVELPLPSLAVTTTFRNLCASAVVSV